MFSITPRIGTSSRLKAVAPRHGVAHGDGLRAGDDDAAGQRHALGQAELGITGAGRQVDDQVVQLAPAHVGEELLDGLVQHGAAPDDRLALRA